MQHARRKASGDWDVLEHETQQSDTAKPAPIPVESRQQTVQNLRDEIALLHSYSTDTIYRLRYSSMTYDYISPNVQRLLGFSAAELSAMNFRDLIIETRNVNEGMRQVDDFGGLEASRKQGETLKWQADYRMRTADDREIWVSDVSYPWVENGSIIGSVGSLRDITDRIDAEETLRHELVKMANSDFLTGLSNRRYFFDQLEQELKRQHRSRSELSIMLIDIDHFKKVNDRFGHPAGDEVLRDIAGIITSCLRETDVAARLGGEEFGVLLPDTNDDGAYWVADRIRREVAKFGFELGESNTLVRCTVSIGVAGAAVEEKVNATRLYKLADSRLYIAKHTGRNQVSMDEVLNLH